MDIWESAKILLRRWYITGPIMIGFLAAAMLLGGQLDPEHRATASMVILPTNAGGAGLFGGTGPTEVNPLDYVGGQTTLTGIQLILTADDTRSDLKASGFSPAYSIDVDARDPLMFVEVVDRNPAVAQSTSDELVILIQEELDALQAAVGAPAGELLEIQVLNQTEIPVEDYSARMRLRIIIAVVGLIVASAAGLLADAWATGRAERRRRMADELADPDGQGPVEATALGADSPSGRHRLRRKSSAPAHEDEDEAIEGEKELVTAPSSMQVAESSGSGSGSRSSGSRSARPA